jgi:exodeoxyribonuclease VII large subunit
MTQDLPACESPYLTVSSLSSLIKGLLENHFDRVRVKGELSNVKAHSSGHIYFALKDHEAVIDGVSWRGQAQKFKDLLQDGIEVICTGRITTYAGRSKYQFVVDHVEVSGEGTLLKLLEDRKKKLAALGLFDPSRKKPLPFLPQVIGIITSPTGAVIRDMLHRFQERCPCRLLLWPVNVQGEGSVEAIVKAIKGFNALPLLGPLPRPDILIVARGGGSLEDLWTFNAEEIAFAVAESQIPLVSAIGHETDTTLIDYVSDYRAPTPTAAAEKVVPVRADILAGLATIKHKLARSIQGKVDQHALHLLHQGETLQRTITIYLQHQTFRLARLQRRHPLEALRIQQQLCHALRQRLDHSTQAVLKSNLHKLTHWRSLLTSLDYQQILKRGFCLATTPEGSLLSSCTDVKPSVPFRVTFHDGIVPVVREKETSSKKRSPSQSPSSLPLFEPE